MRRLLILALLASFGCKGSLVRSPHRSREAELAPAAAEGRFSSVVERAGVFETQNARSREVHWYKVWRGAGMISLGQIDEGEAVVDAVLSTLSQPGLQIAEAARLRMFAYDQKAKAALARKEKVDQPCIRMSAPG